MDRLCVRTYVSLRILWTQPNTDPTQTSLSWCSESFHHTPDWPTAAKKSIDSSKQILSHHSSGGNSTNHKLSEKDFCCKDSTPSPSVKNFKMTGTNGNNGSNGNGNGSARVGTSTVKQGLAQMLKGGVIVS